jgi:S1-C subfamily serine protease
VRLGVVPEQGRGGLRARRVFPGSAAAKAGVQEGDLLTRWDGAALGNPADLQRLLAESEPGQRVRVTLTRAGTEQTLEVILEAQP